MGTWNKCIRNVLSQAPLFLDKLWRSYEQKTKFGRNHSQFNEFWQCRHCQNSWSQLKITYYFKGFLCFFQKKVFFSKSEFGPKLPKNDSKWFFWASLDPKDDLHPFVDDFWPFKILTFSTFFCWKIGYNTNATRADFFENLAFFACFFFDPTLILVGNRQIVKKIYKNVPIT